MSNKTPVKTTTRNRKTIVALLVLFAMPIVLAYMGWALGWFRGVGVAAHGHLLNPVVTDDAYTIETDEPWVSSWYLVVTVDGADCDARCQLNEELARHIRLALGKDANRVRLLWLHTAKTVTGERPSKALEAFEVQGVLDVPSPLKAPRMYIMDPHGNVMLEYEWASDVQTAPLHGKGILRDLKKLLKFSHIG